jgi:hypothetical protein
MSYSDTKGVILLVPYLVLLMFSHIFLQFCAPLQLRPCCAGSARPFVTRLVTWIYNKECKKEEKVFDVLIVIIFFLIFNDCIYWISFQIITPIIQYYLVWRKCYLWLCVISFNYDWVLGSYLIIYRLLITRSLNCSHILAKAFYFPVYEILLICWIFHIKPKSKIS